MKALLLLLALAGSAAAQPGLQLLRKDAQPGLAKQIGVDTLDQLPIYEIDQAIDDVSGKFSAKLTLRYTNLTGAAITSLPLLLHPNAARELGAKDVGVIEITDVTIAGAKAKWTQKRPTLVNVEIGSLAAKAQVTLVVGYKGQLRNLGAQANDMFAQALSSIGSLASSGTSDYGLFGMGDGLVTLASAYPMVAPFREGTFDTAPPTQIGDLAYNTPASFRVRTVLPAGMTLVSNLVDVVAKDHVASEGAVVRDFVMVAGRDLQRAEKRVGDTRVASVFRAKDARGGKVALDMAVSSLKSFERRFGPYPYTELDIAEASIVGGAGGVEFCALTLIAGSLYRDPMDSSSSIALMLNMLSGLGAQLNGGKAPKLDMAKMMDPMLEFTVAHEVAHQWFAEVVGNDSRRFPMLDEPLAQYAAALAVEDRHGAAAAKTAMDTSVKMNYALYRLMGGTDRTVMRDTSTYRSQIEYAGLVYGKAPFLYMSLRKQLGDTKLDKAIRGAVNARRFKLSTLDEWIAALEAGAGQKLKPVFDRWLAKSNGDKDLGVDDSGDFVIGAMLPPDIAKSVREAVAMIGMKPRDLMKMIFGGVLDNSPTGAGIDVDDALKQLGGP